MPNNVMHEITPLTPNDCFTIFNRIKTKFDFPLHYHDEYELNLLINASGAKRVVGGNIETIGDVDLVLIGPNLYHAWFDHECRSTEIIEVTIQFHRDLFDEKFLSRNQMNFVKSMLDRSLRGITFSPQVIDKVKDRLLELDKKNGFLSVLELLTILHHLSVAPDTRTLSEWSFSSDKLNSNSRRVQKVFDYLNSNYTRPVTLAEVSRIANMPEASFSRFIKRRTGKTFIDSLNEIRLGHASRLLIDSTATVAEIAYRCGFNNISNFNRIFKRKKSCNPKVFRETYTDNRVFV
jgi:AraC-like DNA-binding protein